MKNTAYHNYSDPKIAQEYIKYVESYDGKIERQILSQAIFLHLPQDENASILDAACGTGWLTGLLQKKYTRAEGCDSSQYLLNYARQNYPGCVFREADITKEIPNKAETFDGVVFSLAAHDIQKSEEAYIQIKRILKPKGVLIVTIANPYYSFPVGVWKRGIAGKILRQKASLRLRPYHKFSGDSRKFFWKRGIPSYFHGLPKILNNAIANGFQLDKMEEVSSNNPKAKGREWQLFLFPMIFLFVFRKK